MKIALPAATALVALALPVQAYTIDQFDRSATLSGTYAPIAISSSGAYVQDVMGAASAKSPFVGTIYSSNAFDAVRSNGTATFSASSFGQSSGLLGTFAFIFGSPDSYNTLTFKRGGSTVLSLTGNQIGSTSGNGYYLTRISDIGEYDSVTFGSRANSFEFAALSPVPLPGSAPMFGAALLALGAIGYGVKRKKAAAQA